MSTTKSTINGRGGDRPKRRTRRACDCCRIKKAKCDGGSRCKTCKANDSSCTYTARRGRDARSFYCRMRDVYEEALQRLYWACRQGRDFPGDIPDESTGTVTTDAILRELGLIGPAHEEPTLASAKSRKDLESSTEDQRHDQDQPYILSTAEDSTHNDQEDSSPTTRSPFSSSSRSYNGSGIGSVPSLTQGTTTTTEMNSDMNAYSPQQDIHQPSDLDSMSATPAMSNSGYGIDVESYLNVDAFLDANFCGTSDVSGTWENFTDTMLFKNHHGQVNGPSFSE